MSDLSYHLKTFLTPAQRDKLRLALAACDSWTIPTPPKSSEPEKVIDWEDGDWWELFDGDKMLMQMRGDKMRCVLNHGLCIWQNRYHDKTPIAQIEGDARAAALGYTVKRAEKVEAGAAKVFEFQDGDVVTKDGGDTILYLHRRGVAYLFGKFLDLSIRSVDNERRDWEIDATRAEVESHLAKFGWTAKWPAPASDSVKGERDIFGREIIERLGGAFIVKCEDGDYAVTRADGQWWDGESWNHEESASIGALTIKVAKAYIEEAAASLELPTANPAASAKVDAYYPPFLNGTDAAATCEALARRIENLERDLAELRGATK